MGKINTPWIYKWAASGVNDLTGGTDYMSGLVDFHPETMQYLVNYIGGGAGQFGSQFVLETLDAIHGEPYEIDNAPIIGSFISRDRGFDDVSKFMTDTT